MTKLMASKVAAYYKAKESGDLATMLPELNANQLKMLERYVDIRVLEAKSDLLSWCLSRTSLDEVKQRWGQIDQELLMKQEAPA